MTKYEPNSQGVGSCLNLGGSNLILREQLCLGTVVHVEAVFMQMKSESDLGGLQNEQARMQLTEILSHLSGASWSACWKFNPRPNISAPVSAVGSALN